MGTVAVAGELAGSDELDEVCRVDLSETEPEDDDEEDDEDDEDETGARPEGMPHE